MLCFFDENPKYQDHLLLLMEWTIPLLMAIGMFTAKKYIN